MQTKFKRVRDEHWEDQTWCDYINVIPNTWQVIQPIILYLDDLIFQEIQRKETQQHLYRLIQIFNKFTSVFVLEDKVQIKEKRDLEHHKRNK